MAIRRPVPAATSGNGSVVTNGQNTGRGVLSMSGLSYGVIRVDQENSLTSLTLQDCGRVLPEGKCLTNFYVKE